MSRIHEIEITIRGMTCEHCATTVKGAVEGIAGVKEATVDFESRNARVRGVAPIDVDEVTAAVKSAGYGAELVGGDPPAEVRDPVAFDRRAESDDARHNADLIVVGGGSAGFAAAIAGHDAGRRVIMINDGVIGGTCVNVGCVPSKTLIRAAETHRRAQAARFHGIESSSKVTGFAAIRDHKDELVASLRTSKYIDVLTAHENIRLVEGRARFISPTTVAVDDVRLHAKRIVVVTGSRPWVPPIPGLREADPLTSTTAFELDRLPESMIILGGRYIALETAQLFSRLGVRVTVLQRSSHVLPQEDEDVSEALTGYLREEGLTVETSVTVERVATSASGVTVHAGIGGDEWTFSAERILCATGRRAITDGLDLQTVEIAVNPDGTIKVDEQLRTSVESVYAAGDVIGEPQFVYTAAYEGRLAVENAFAEASSGRNRDYTALPWVIFSDPQLAGVGHNEKSAADAGIDIEVATIDLKHVPRALAARDTRGFVKLIRERGTDRLIGARILAPEGGEQIMEAAMAIRHGIPVRAIASAFHPYLTQSEAVKLCAQAFDKDVAKMSCCA